MASLSHADFLRFSADDDEEDFNRTSQEVPPIPIEYLRTSAGELTQNHIEITERADGSVVWQGERVRLKHTRVL